VRDTATPDAGAGKICRGVDVDSALDERRHAGARGVAGRLQRRQVSVHIFMAR